MATNFCIYHGNCLDGFTGAWIVNKFFDGNVTLYPGVHQVDPPDVKDKHVIFVDFSYKRPVMEGILRDAASVTIFDHHKSAIENLEGLRFTRSVFDTSRSGAMLAWNFYFPDKFPPEFVKYVQDRDLWTRELLYSREVSAAMFAYEYDLEVWDSFARMDMMELAKQGTILNKKLVKDIKDIINSNKREMVIGGHRVPVVNIPYTMVSEACNFMNVGVPFAAAYSDTSKVRVFSLRSAEDGIDVSEVAKLYGGGGHFHAAGFSVPIGWEGDACIGATTIGT